MKLRKLAPLVLTVSLLAILLTGCFGGKTETNLYSVTGTVAEEGTNTPLSGVTVKIDDNNTKTNSLGQYELTNVPGGTVTITAEAEGYSPGELKNVKVDANLVSQDLRLSTEAPLITTENISLQISTLSGDEPLVDGAEFEEVTKFRIKGSVADLLPPQPSALGEPIIVGLDVLINGEVYEVVITNGMFDEEIPLDPGENWIQLRIWDNGNHARTSDGLKVFVRFPRLDIRVVLTWDTLTDIDLHFIKRAEDEEYEFYYYEFDRHVFYANKRPGDFGETSKENPFLDIDDVEGFGPETIILEEANPGDYHIWLHPYALHGIESTNTKVKVYLDQGADHAVEREFHHEFLLEDYFIGSYITTIRVSESGVKEFVQIPVPEDEEE